MKYIVSIVFLFFVGNAFSDEKAVTECEKLDAQGAQEGSHIMGDVAARKVIGAGRLYIYSGPDSKCLDKNIFVIPGDELTAYTEYKEFTSIMYINTKTNKDFTGWVLTGRLAESGLGISPKQANGQSQ